MKTVPATLQTHIAQEVTAMCTCWRIARVDGKIFYLTDAVEDVVEGGNTYKSMGAYKRTAIQSTATLSVDNLDVIGIANTLVLPETELRAGLFDNATVRVFLTSWQGSVPGELKMRRGFFGEVTVLPNGTYQVELRGLMQRLGYTYTGAFTADCRVDLGSRECGIPIPKGSVERTTAYAVGDTIIAPTTAKMNLIGTYRKLPIGDSGFEVSGPLGNFDSSLYWRTRGEAAPTFSTVFPFAGNYSLEGGAGVSNVTQDIDLTDTAGLTAALIDSNQTLLTLYGWRRDTANTARLSLSFLDCDLTEVGFGRAVRANATKMTPSAPITLAGDFTIESWVYLNAGASSGSAGLGGFGTSMTDSAGDHGDIRFDPPRLLSNLNGVAPVSYGQSSVTLTTGRWYHVAVSRRVSDGQVTTYVDGKQVGQSSGFTTPFNLDFLMSTITGTTDAVYDEYRVWNTVRPGYEIANNARKTLTGTELGLIHYWRFNASDGAAATGTETVNTGSNTFVSDASPVAVNLAHTPIATPGETTGLENVGTTWVLRYFADRAIPIGARYARIGFDSTGIGTYIDSLFGWTLDRTGDQIPSILADNTHYVCTVAGSTAATIPTYGGTTVVDGTATFALDTNAWARNGIVTASEGARIFRATVTDVRAVDAWFNGGVVTFETGPNTGVSMEVKNWTQSTGQIELFLSVPFNVEPGDIFRVYPGCDKSIVSCAAIFGNAPNYRGFPDVPGQDALFSYPDARQ